MVKQRTFGRRASPQPPRVRPPTEAVQPRVKAWSGETPAEQSQPRQESTEYKSVEDELKEWKRARGRNLNLPWRQIWLTASLCFGLASFVLPDTVNDQVDWLLYGLMAASAYAGFTRRRKEKRTNTEHAVGIVRDLTGL